MYLDIANEKKIKIAKTRITNSNPFFGLLLLSMKIYPVGDVEYMRTNGEDIEYNPSFISSITIGHLVFALEHELYHKAFMHVYRLGNKDLEKWNIATDISIHCTMIGAGKHTDIIIDNNYYYDKKFNNKTAEEIYVILNNDEKEFEKQSGKNSLDVHEYSKRSNEQSKNDAMSMVRASFKISAGYACGTELTAIKTEFYNTINKKHDFNDILRKFFEDAFKKTDYSFMERDRRFSEEDFCLPSIVNVVSKDIIKKVVVGFDVSLSISEYEIREFANVVSEIAEDYCDEIHLMFCSDVLHEYIVFKKEKMTILEVPVGYGTSFIPVFEKIKTEDINPKLLLYLTDLQVSKKQISRYTPDFDVVWIKSGPGFSYTTPPFGEVIELKTI